jgi:methylmalonyl-CoA mutase
VRARATVGEISDALEKVFGRHEARSAIVAGVYAARRTRPAGRPRASGRGLRRREGRRPRILVAKMGQDGHDRGQKVIARPSPISASTSTWARCSRRPTRPPAGGRERRARGGRQLAGRRPPHAGARAEAGAGRARPPDILVVVGGVIPPQDYAALYAAGAAAIFGPGT